MKTKNVIVIPYDKQWVNEFEKIKSQITAVLGTTAISVEHVGSTSVFGLWAKPIIDIDVVIKDETVLLIAIKKLESIGYHYEGDLGIEGRYAFCYDTKPNLMLHHLYVCPQNSKELNRHICFRNYLRDHHEAVEKYSQIKREAASLFPNDIDRYIAYKSSVIEEIYTLCRL
ncbi:MAG: GrpB family protein [Anaerovoracaceae bacterium]